MTVNMHFYNENTHAIQVTKIYIFIVMKPIIREVVSIEEV